MSDQTQGQAQNVTVNVESSGDPELEGRILNELFSVGKQLGSLASVVELLLATRSPDFMLTNEQLTALNDFQTMQQTIVEEKRRRRPARITAELERLATESAEAHPLRDELRRGLSEFDRGG